MIGRQVGSGSCRLIVLTAVLCTSGLAMAEDKDVVISTPISLVSDTSYVGIGAAKPEPLVLEPREPRGVAQAAAEQNATSSPRPLAQGGGVQNQIQRQARRLQAGVRGGVALDPELILMGVQAQFGPVFNSNVSFRPSVEFAYGEVTAMFGLNGEFIYRLSRSLDDRWSTYFGGGLGVNLTDQNFSEESNGRRIDFDDFHSDSALNILGGVQNQNGIFMELRTSVYSDPSPTLRLVFGYNF
jgi:hypothetical protein